MSLYVENGGSDERKKRAEHQPPPITTQTLQPMANYGSSTGYVQANTGPIVLPAVCVTVPTTALRYPIAVTYKSQQSKGLGITLVVIAILAFIFNIVGLNVDHVGASIGHGFWCGIPLFLSGAFGIASANRRRGFIIAFMVFTIFSTIFSVPMFFISLDNASDCGNRRCRYVKLNHCGPCNYPAVAMESLLATIAIIGAIASLWGSAICCAVVCCGPSQYGMANSTPYGNQQLIILNQPQQQPGAVQMPMNFPQVAHPAGSVDPPQQQNWVGPFAQQQYPPQQYMHGCPSAPGDGPPVTPPPAYSTINFKESVNG